MTKEEMYSLIRLGLIRDATEWRKRFFLSRKLEPYDTEIKWRDEELCEYFAADLFSADEFRAIESDDCLRSRDF